MEFSIDINARPVGQVNQDALADDLLDHLTERRFVVQALGPAVSQDVAAGTIGATFGVEADTIDTAYALARVHFGTALSACGVERWTYTEFHVGPPASPIDADS